MAAGSKRATVHGSAGHHARLKGLLLATWPVFFAMLAGGYLIRAALPQPEISRPVAGLLFIGLAVVIAALVGSGSRKLADFFKGAQGEETVARELGFLPQDFRVFNCLASGKEALLPSSGDYDHVVVGPSGIFVVETKNWSGKITLENGQILYDGKVPDRPPINQVKAAARSLRVELTQACGADVEVRPVICFAADTFQGGVSGATGVMVCNLRDLNKLIQQPPDNPPASEVLRKASALLNDLIA